VSDLEHAMILMRIIDRHDLLFRISRSGSL